MKRDINGGRGAGFNTDIGFWPLLLIFAGLFLMLIFIVSLLQHALAGAVDDRRTGFLISSTLQSVIAFMMPPLIVAAMKSRRPLQYLGACGGMPVRWWIGIALFFILALPALDQVIWWNSEMHLPESFNSWEQKFRDWEESASTMTEVILSGSSWWTLLSGVLVVGVLTGLAEETFFRAGLQKLMTSYGVNHHLAIWLAAFIFSAFHFQFFGFFPRLLLGAVFGYLYWWTGSLWCSALAHAVNNSIVVVTAWLAARGCDVIDMERLGVVTEGFPWWFAISAILTTVFFLFFRKWFFTGRQSSDNSDSQGC